MILSEQEIRPPYVVFELRPEEDRTRSQLEGHPVYNDVPYALVTPQGSKDRIERRATEWLASLRQQADNGRVPESWYMHFKAAFEAWQKGLEIPVMGTPLRTWPVITPALLKTCVSFGVTTVEDLAKANDEMVGRLGMGGLALKEKAATWLRAAKDSGKIVEENAALKLQNAALLARIATLEERCAKLEKAAAPAA